MAMQPRAFVFQATGIYLIVLASMIDDHQHDGRQQDLTPHVKYFPYQTLPAVLLRRLVHVQSRSLVKVQVT